MSRGAAAALMYGNGLELDPYIQVLCLPRCSVLALGLFFSQVQICAACAHKRARYITRIMTSAGVLQAHVPEGVS